MDISVVVPFYNEERYIEGCIKSLLAQNYPDEKYEIIMIDNNSTDRSVPIVKQYPRVRLLSEAEPGDFAARNRGIHAASGTIIAFTDADSAPSTEWLPNIATAMLNPDIAIIVGSLHFGAAGGLLSLIANYESEKARYILSGDTRETYFGYTCNMAVQKTVFDRLGPFPAVYRNSDVIFVRKVVDIYSCDAVCYSPDICVQRLEVSNLLRYFCKLHMYGRDFRRYSKIASVRALSNTERLEIFKKTIQKEDCSFAKSLFLFGMLFIGGICYELGRVRSV